MERYDNPKCPLVRSARHEAGHAVTALAFEVDILSWQIGEKVDQTLQSGVVRHHGTALDPTNGFLEFADDGPAEHYFFTSFTGYATDGAGRAFPLEFISDPVPQKGVDGEDDDPTFAAADVRRTLIHHGGPSDRLTVLAVTNEIYEQVKRTVVCRPPFTDVNACVADYMLQHEGHGEKGAKINRRLLTHLEKQNYGGIELALIRHDLEQIDTRHIFEKAANNPALVIDRCRHKLVKRIRSRLQNQ